MKKVITIDCDEVLCDTAHYMLNYTDFFGDKRYEDITIENLTKMYYYIHDHLELLQEQDPDSIQRMQPIFGAQEKIKLLYDLGYELYVITGRTDSMKDFTYQWLDFYFPRMIKEVFFCNNYKSKALAKVDFCHQVGSELMIDDDPRFVDDIVDIPVLLMNRPWNEYYSGKGKNNVTRVFGWEEISLVKN